MEGDDMGMAKGLEDLDLAIEILSKLLVEPLELDRFDGDSGLGLLFDAR